LAREAERLLREVLADRVRGGNTNRWRLADATNRLGFALVASAVTDAALSTEQRQARFIEAEGLLQPSGTYLIKSRTSDPPDRREALTRFVRLYEAWAAAAPAAGKAAEVAKWREALAQFDRAASPKAPAAGPEQNPPNPAPQ
jgi:hypothetical protein